MTYIDVGDMRIRLKPKGPTMNAKKTTSAKPQPTSLTRDEFDALTDAVITATGLDSNRVTTGLGSQPGLLVLHEVDEGSKGPDRTWHRRCFTVTEVEEALPEPDVTALLEEWKEARKNR